MSGRYPFGCCKNFFKPLFSRPQHQLHASTEFNGLLSEYTGRVSPERNEAWTKKAARYQKRTAFSLIEVLLATAIMAVGMAALVHHSHQASQAAIRASLEAVAATRCESAFNMTLVDRASNQLLEVQKLLSDDEWLIEITSTSTGNPGLSSVSQKLTIRATYRLRPDLCQFELTSVFPEVSP